MICQRQLNLCTGKFDETMSETNFFLTIFFWQNVFSDKKYFSSIFSQTGFCLRLNFVSDFVCSCILQLYFVCNPLIFTFITWKRYRWLYTITSYWTLKGLRKIVSFVDFVIMIIYDHLNNNRSVGPVLI